MKFKLLSDKPRDLSLEDGDDFGSVEIAAALSELIIKAPLPHVIGLFGKWGVGKTSIIEQIRAEDKSRYSTVYIDCWKYEQTALLRSFVSDIILQLNKREEDGSQSLNDKDYQEIRDKLYITKSVSSETPVMNWVNLIKTTLLGFGIYMLLPQGFKTLTNFIGSLGIGALITTLMKEFTPYYTKLVISSDNLSSTEDRASTAEEFESLFQSILSRAQYNKLVVIIDNLDRLEGERVVNVLSTIKTFLNTDSSIDKVIFLIACDDDAIKTHVAQHYAKEGSDGQSQAYAALFLQKIFNTTLSVPSFVDTEISTVTRKYLEATSIPDLLKADIALLINFAFKDSPRQIKQFVNQLVAYYVLFSHRKKSIKAEKELLSENICFITLILILKQRAPRVYAHMEKKVVNNGLTWDELHSTIISNENVERREFEEITREFSWIKPSQPQIAVFFTLRRSAEDRELTGWDQLLVAVEKRDTESVRKQLKSLASKSDKFTRTVRQYITRHTSNRDKLLPFISELLTALTEERGLVNSLKPHEIISIFIKFMPKNVLPIFKPGTPELLIKEFYPSLDSEDLKNRMVGGIIDAFVSGKEGNPSITLELALEIAKLIANNPEIFKSHYQKITQGINDIYSTNIEVLAAITQKGLTAVISNDTVKKYLEFFDQSRATEMTQLLSRLISQGLAVESPQVLERIMHVARQFSNDPALPGRDVFAKATGELLTTNFQKFNNGDLASNYEELFGIVRQWHAEEQNFDKKENCLQLLIAMTRLIPGHDSDQSFKDFINACPLGKLKSLVEEDAPFRGVCIKNRDEYLSRVLNEAILVAPTLEAMPELTQDLFDRLINEMSNSGHPEEKRQTLIESGSMSLSKMSKPDKDNAILRLFEKLKEYKITNPQFVNSFSNKKKSLFTKEQRKELVS